MSAVEVGEVTTQSEAERRQKGEERKEGEGEGKRRGEEREKREIKGSVKKVQGRSHALSAAWTQSCQIPVSPHPFKKSIS